LFDGSLDCCVGRIGASPHWPRNAAINITHVDPEVIVAVV